MNRNTLPIVILMALMVSCQTTRPYLSKSEYKWESLLPDTTSTLLHSIYLIGDAGAPKQTPLEPSLHLLRAQLNDSDQENTSVVFLGDNIYHEGLHKKDTKERKQDEQHINTQLDILKDFEGRVVFLPGNHDWQNDKSDGDKYVQRQEKYIEKYLDKGNTFLPDGGCAGPVEIELAKRLLWVIIDTQWWLHPHDKPKGDKDDCEVNNKEEYILQIEDILKKNQNKQIIISAHHPLYSNGLHGGYFPLKDHIFPLTNLKDNLYIPLPVIGSIYPLYRKFFGHIQDIPHFNYQLLVEELSSKFNGYQDIVYTSGHEHSLQYQKHGTAHYVVSGSACKESYLIKNRNLLYGQSQNGFAKLNYYANGDLWLEYFVPDATTSGKLTYRKQLRKGHRVLEVPKQAKLILSQQDSMVTVIPGGKYYQGGRLKEIFFGSLYRDIWTAPINVPVIDISKEHGGLKPTSRGGGMQSKSLRLTAPDGKEYVLRSIQKFPATILPKALRQTVVKEVIQDVIAASHPYAAIVVPTMADAAGVYHTNPQLVYLPDDPALGQYQNEFGGLLCLYEERPDDDQSDVASFGNSKDVKSTSKVIEKIRESYDNQVDQLAFLRARLFDLMIGDWDRHDDQWRWASFEEGKRTTYKPIPRDRDQVFYKVDGIAPNIINNKPLERRFQPFTDEIKDMRGMNFNGRYIDRAFLTKLEWKDWKAMVDTLQHALTDEVFMEALALFPDTAQVLHNERLLRTLKVHREKLKEFAREYYLILAEEVNVVGTYEDEYFKVERMNDEETLVTIYMANKSGEIEKDKITYNRLFLTKETKEIRIFGLDGDDNYEISGNVKKGPRISFIGGNNTDTYLDKSTVRGISKKTRIFDKREKKAKNANKFVTSKETRLFIAEKEDDQVLYERNSFKYDLMAPKLAIGYNPDDGVFLGPGFDFKKYGFNRIPYAYRHQFGIRYAIATGAFNFKYLFVYRSLAYSKWNLEGELHFKAPDYRFNFYGLGNETQPLSENMDDNRLRLNFIEFSPLLSRYSSGDIHKFAFGPTYNLVNPPSEEDKVDIPTQFQPLLDFRNESYLGVKAYYQLKKQDDPNNPKRGINYFMQLSWNKGIEQRSTNYMQLKSEFALFFPFLLLPDHITMALRSGVAANFGEYRFFQANYIGGYSEIRGILRNRFGGDVSFYNNAELRIKLFNSYNYILPFEFGMITFYDTGRVWYENENSTIWHNSYGAGIYLSPLNFMVLSATYGISRNDEVLNLGLGFFF